MSKTEKYGISNKGILCSIALLMTLIMCMFFPICVKAEENYRQDEFEYEVIDQKAYIVDYFGTDEDVIVPAELGGYTVVGIRQRAFMRKDTIKKLTFSEGLVFLESESIAYCNNLEYVYFPSTYGNDGDSMGFGGVMYGCDNLATVEISPENKNLKVYEDAVYSADMKTLIFYPPACTREVLSIPDGVEVISSDSCRDNIYLKEITMTDSVKTIGYWAFIHDSNVERIRISENCTVISQFALQGLAIETLHIPASVEFIMSSAICDNSKLKEITVDAENKTYHSDNGVLCSKNSVVCYPIAKSDEKYVVEDGITSIAMSAFNGAKFLKEVVLPESMESIGVYAFFDCTNLEKINLPDGITNIDDSVFANDTRLKSISIPSSMTYVPEDIINNLNVIIIPESVEMIEKQRYLNPSEFTAYFYGNVPENVDNILQFSNEKAFTVYYPKVSEEWAELKEAYSANNIEWIPMDTPIQCIQISNENLAMEIASSQQLSVSYKPLLTSDDTTVTWESSDLEVAVVDNTGMVTAVGEGKATISAKIGTQEAICNVTVTEHKHSYGTEWTIEKAATCMEEGVKTQTCTTCGMIKTESIEKLDTHTFSSTWIKNAECHWHVCTVSGCESVSEKALHTAGEWIVDKEATLQSEGSKHKECTTCGYVIISETIPKLVQTTNAIITDAGLYLMENTREHILIGIVANTSEPTDIEYRWSAKDSSGVVMVIQDWTLNNEWLNWIPDGFGEYTLIAEARVAGNTASSKTVEEVVYFNPYIKGKCQLPYAMVAPGQPGYLIGVETYENPNQSYQYEMLILDCTLLAQGKDAWIYTTGKFTVTEGAAGWCVWQPQYGYYWTLFRVYDKDGNMIDQACYGFVNAN